MSAFQAYSGAYDHGRQLYRWSCYATCRVYEVRPIDGLLPPAPGGRKWVARRVHGQTGPQVAMLVDGPTDEFSQMLAQVTLASREAVLT
jgi:hypothetical protein